MEVLPEFVVRRAETLQEVTRLLQGDANARILAFGRADGAFLGQWMAPRRGDAAGLLDEVLGMEVLSTPDGPPAAYLLTPDRVIRVVLE